MPRRDKHDRRPPNEDFSVELMEPRLLLSADALGIDVGVLDRDTPERALREPDAALAWWRTAAADDATPRSGGSDSDRAGGEAVRPTGTNDATVQDDDVVSDTAVTLPTSDENGPPRREVVFLDAGVVDGEQLLTELLGDDRAVLQIHVIDTADDGIAQIGAVLDGLRDIDAVHIISHGAQGEVRLGSTTLSTSTLDEHAAELRGWRGAFTESGDIHVYGCDLASDPRGRTFVGDIGTLAGADVTASIDRTGSADRGGDWELEYDSGVVETVSFAAPASSTWSGALSVINVTTFDDLVDGGDTSSVANLIATPGTDGISLREAVIASNNDAGVADTINLSAGTYTLAIGGAGEDGAATGDLDILDALTITGAGADQTVIDGAGLDRVFEVIAGSAFDVSISDVKIQNGLVDNRGGGLHVGNVPAAPSVTLTNVWFSANKTFGTSDSGGAIFNRGTLAIVDSLIEGNSAETGGGVMNFLGGQLNMTNVTLSGNAATAGDGGGLINESVADLSSVTVADNSAAGSGGGLHNVDASGATTGMVNTLVANNLGGSDPDLSGTFDSAAGVNLIEDPDAAAGLDGDDITGIDPDITALGDHGGPTPTHALNTASPAIDAGTAAGAPGADQRGETRDTVPDIGAYELQKPTGTAVWRDGGLTTPQTSDWDGSNFSAETNFSAMQDVRFMTGAEAPTRDELIVVAVDGQDDTIKGEIWDGSSWTALPFAMSMPTHTNWSGFDVAYEAASGDAVVVWNDVTGISYRVWNGSAWSGEATLTLPVPGEPDHIDLVSSPDSDEMILVSRNENGATYAVVWDGDSWNSGQLLSASSAVGANVHAAYESQSGDAMVVYGDGSSSLNYRLWDGASWGGAATVNEPSASGNVRWTTLASDAGTDRVALSVYTGTEAWFGIWDGTSSWDTVLGGANTNAVGTFLNTGISFEAESGDALAVYTDQANTNDEIAYRTWDGSWSAELVGPDIGGLANAMLMSSAPSTDGVMLSVQNGAQELNHVFWNGSAWESPQLLETATGEIKHQPFTFVWDQSGIATPDDSDGDGLRDNEEDANSDLDTLPSTSPGPDTDGDGDPNYLDADDDGDGTPTSAENADPNADGDPRDAIDSDRDGQPDYLDLVTGGSDGMVVNEQKISDTEGGLAATLDTDDRFGRAVAGIGDLDRDGINDMAVGAPQDNDGGINRGSVRILFLNADGTVKTEQRISSVAGGLAAVIDDDDRFGVSVSSIGDINGDGIVDIAVGAQYDDDGGTDRGAVYILFLDTDGTVKAEQKISDTTGGLAATLDDFDIFGRSVTGVGDLDGDGSNDIAVGAARDDDGGVNRGSVYILFLNADGTVKAEQKISSVAGGLAASIDDDDRFGVSVSGIGDIDGDGVLDIAVGAQSDDDGGTDRGAVHILFLDSDGTVGAEQKISSSEGGLTATLGNDDKFGASVAGVGDLDNDGIGDISVGATHDDDGGSDRGAVHTLFLNPDGTVQAEQKISSTSGGFTGPLTDGDQFGKAVAGLGDLDGDGAIDIAVGAWYDDDGGTNQGAVHVLFQYSNASPTLTAFGGVVDSTNEDTEVEISFADFATQGDESDPDGTVDAFVVEAIASGALRIGATSATATAWATGTNDLVDGSNNAYWTPASNASGTLNAFDVVVRDNQDADSSGSVTAAVVVTAQNDEQVLATNTGTTVAEGSTGTVISAAMLATTDADDPATALVYTVTAAPANGTVRLSGTALGLGDTFTQDDIDAGRLTYDHDSSDTTNDSVGFSVDDGSGAASTGTFALTVTNAEQVLATNTGTTVAEGSTGTVISAAMLATTDADDPATALVYTVTAAPANGTVRLSGTALGLGDTFTQDDIDNGRLTYDHDSSDTTNDSVGFSVDDGSGAASTGTFALTVTNAEQVLATNTGATVAEGSSGTVISAAMLATTDADDPATALVYEITAAPANGTVRLSGTALGMGDTFTQDDIDNGRLTYDHDSSDTTNDSVGFSVDDGSGAASTGTFALTVTNAEQVLATNTGATVAEGSSGTVISAAMLATTDADDPATALVYEITAAPANGTARLSGTALGLGDTFTQDDIDNSRLTYDHDSSDTTGDSVGFSVDDGSGAASTGTFALTVTNAEQVLATNTGATVAEGSSGTVISAAMLATTDADDPATALVYEITAAPANGTVRLSGTALGMGDTFTQDDIDAGRLTYDHDSSDTTNDSVGFSVDDGSGAASTGTFALTITNAEQVLATNTGTTVAEGSTGTVISAAMLATTDADDPATALVYEITAAPANGTVRLSGTALGMGDTFTQDDIDNSRLTYDHDSSDTTGDSVGFSVDDGSGAASTGTFALTVTNAEQVLATNTGTTVAEGSTGTVISAAMLATTDADDPATALVYTVTAAPANGTVRLSGTALGLGDTFTQDDIDAGRLTYDHDSSDTTNDSVGFSVDDGSGAASTGTFALTVTNAEQVLATNTGATVAEGSSGTVISAAMLATTDADDPATALVYEITAAPANGTVRLSGTALGMGDTFTQDDIDNSRLTYDHDSSDTTGDGFGFSVDDGSGAASTGTFALTVTNAEQVLATNTGATVAEGSTGTVISAAMLATTDADDPATALVYTVTAAPANGTVRLSGTALGLGDTFTQDDIDAGRLTYDHDSSDTTNDSVGFSVDDGSGAASTGTFALTVTNAEQVLATNTGTTVAEGSTGTVISAAMLATTDADDPATALVYEITAAPANGTVRLSGTALGMGDTFTQDDIDNSRLTYDHDSSDTTGDSVGFSVDDGSGAASTGTFALTVTNAEQVLATNTGATVAEGSSGTVISAAMLATTDADDPATALVYTVTAAPANGTARLSGTALGLGDTFTQDDIDNGRLTYDHDSSDTTNDSVGFSVDDGSGAASTGTFALTVTNAEQVLATNTGATVAEGSSGTVISAAMLATTDADDPATALVYTVTAAPANGTARLSGTALGLGDTFTQDDIDNSRLTYDHDGSESIADRFDFSVDDGAGGATTATFALTVAARNDSPVLANPTADQTAFEGEPFALLIDATAFRDSDSVDLFYQATRSDGTDLPDWLTFDPDTRSFSGTPRNGDIAVIDIGVVVRDSDGGTARDDFRLVVLPVDEPPAIESNRLVLQPGSTVTLTPDMLSVSDVDTPDADLRITFSELIGGQFELNAEPGVPIDGFTRAQLVAGEVVFVDDGDNVPPSYRIVVSDGTSVLASQAAEIAFDAPRLQAAAPTAPSAAPHVDSPDTTIRPDIELVTIGDSSMPDESPPGSSRPSEARVSELETESESGEPILDEERVGQIHTEPAERSTDTVRTPDSGEADAPFVTRESSRALLQTLSAPPSTASLFELDPVTADVRLVLAEAGFQESLDRMRSDMNDASAFQKAVVGMGVVATTGLSVGYVAWLLRGGVMLSAVLSSLPAWQFIDPLPVLAHSDEGEEEGSGNDDSLEDIIRDREASDVEEPPADPEESAVSPAPSRAERSAR